MYKRAVKEIGLNLRSTKLDVLRYEIVGSQNTKYRKDPAEILAFSFEKEIMKCGNVLLSAIVRIFLEGMT